MDLVENKTLVWRQCSSCKKPIGLNTVYWTCNVSTCNRKRTGLLFCSVECWDAHVPLYNHRESWAIESRSPRSLDEPSKERPSEEQLEKEIDMTESGEKEILIVASKLKNYIRAKSGMNTSGAVIDVLSDKVRELCDQAVEAAKRDGRKTVMDRDFS